MDALGDAIDRYFESREAPGIISLEHKDVPIGVPIREWTFDDGSTVRSHIDGDVMYLVGNIANDTEKAKEARYRALTGDLDGYSVTVYSKEEGMVDGTRVTTACDLHAVTLGSDEKIVNPDAQFEVVDYKQWDNRFVPRLIDRLDQKMDSDVDQSMTPDYEELLLQKMRKDPDVHPSDDPRYYRGPGGAFWTKNQVKNGIGPWADDTDYGRSPTDIMTHYESKLARDDAESALELARQVENGEATMQQAAESIQRIYDDMEEFDAQDFLAGVTTKGKFPVSQKQSSARLEGVDYQTDSQGVWHPDGWIDFVATMKQWNNYVPSSIESLGELHRRIIAKEYTGQTTMGERGDVYEYLKNWVPEDDAWEFSDWLEDRYSSV